MFYRATIKLLNCGLTSAKNFGMSTQEHHTERLILRNWRPSDKAPFAQMNADPDVMEHFPELLTKQKSDDLVDIITSMINTDGLGFWAVAKKGTNEFIGFIGLNRFSLDLPFCPCVEIGWRLARTHWGKGYATEGALKSLEIGFEQFQLNEIYSFAVLKNTRSRRVMTRIGMQDTGNNFMHPAISEESHLQEHCLYKITKNEYK